MLKSTHKPASASFSNPLPSGWTEHKAPTGEILIPLNGISGLTFADRRWGVGHTYYYNADTKLSTYTRPRLEQATHPLQNDGAAQHYAFPNSQGILPTAHAGWHRDRVRASGGPHVQVTESQSSNSFAERHRQYQRSKPKDRPKTKHEIPGCEPWLLVKTRLGRRFVYDPSKDRSFWKFPPEVMKGVVEYDRQEREKRQKFEHQTSPRTDEGDVAAAEPEYTAAEAAAPTAAVRPAVAESRRASEQQGSDEEYEEVEVTDDDEANEGTDGQRSREAAGTDHPMEFDEDDIAYQLQAMGQDYGLDPGEYGVRYDEELEEGAQGLALTEEESKALFMDMLEDFQINPYTTWEALIEAGHIVEDDRYTILPNMRSRKDVWSEWSRNKIQQLKDQREKTERKDPKIPFFAFLQTWATPKLYWSEFRRKFQKEPEMRNTKLSDKDREKWYREYINRKSPHPPHGQDFIQLTSVKLGLRLPESTLKSDMVKLLKTIPLHEMNGSTKLESLPAVLLTDMRFISLRTSLRDDLLEAHIASLPPAPTNIDISPEEEQTLAKEKQERERRAQALADRQSHVQDEKRRQQGALRQSKGILREGELEVKRAMQVGKQGLLGHRETREGTTANEEKTDSG